MRLKAALYYAGVAAAVAAEATLSGEIEARMISAPEAEGSPSESAGEAAHRSGLIYGFWIVGAMYAGAGLAAWLPVRRGIPTNIGGLTDVVNSPVYATGVGLVVYGSKNATVEFPSHTVKSNDESLFRRVARRMKEWFGEFF